MYRSPTVTLYTLQLNMVFQKICREEHIFELNLKLSFLFLKSSVIVQIQFFSRKILTFESKSKYILLLYEQMEFYFKRYY